MGKLALSGEMKTVKMQNSVTEEQERKERFTMKIVLIKETKSYCVYRNGEKIGWFVELSNVLDLVAMEIKDALDE